MKHCMLALTLFVVAACGKSAEERARDDMAKDQAAHPDPTPPSAPSPVQHGSAATAAETKPAPPPAPEPTTPQEIEHARNQAMIDGRDKDVLKYCDMGKLDDKSNPQALLGCTLAACRLKDEDTAKRYAKPLPKLLMDQAQKVCATYHITVP
jgi:hypothetical protein